MQTKWKRSLPLLLVVLMTMSLLCSSAWAAEQTAAKHTATEAAKPALEELEKQSEETIPFDYMREQGCDGVKEEERLQTASVNATDVDLYAVDPEYEEYLTIPASYAQSYQIKTQDGSNATYTIRSGKSVTVSSSGLIEPAKITWYLQGNSGGFSVWTTTYIEGAETRVEAAFGTSVVRVKDGSDSYEITITVHDYAKEYAQQVMDDYVESSITDSMSDLEKLKAITAFPAQYNYSANFSGYTGLVVAGGGDCWASTSAILYLCEKVGLPAHIRYAANDSGAGSGHRNVAALIGSDVYIADAGYSGTAPRFYSVSKENIGFTYKRLTGNDISIVQYDGFDSDIVVPSVIDGYTVTTIGDLALYYGEYYSEVPVKSLTLPDTLTTLERRSLSTCSYLTSVTIPANVNTIGEFALTNCRKLEKIHVAAGNQNFSSVDGVLYDAAGKQLLFYPSAGAERYVVPEGVRQIADYAFYYTNTLTTVFLPASISEIGVGAFGNSALSEIYFAGNRPDIGVYAFRYNDLTAYYPKGDTTWENIGGDDAYGADSITWKAWNTHATKLSDCSITFPVGDYIYNGAEQTPEVIVKDGDKILVKGTDYEISYSNNVNSGTAYVTLTAIAGGDYAGMVKVPFTIQKAVPTLEFEHASLHGALSRGTTQNTLRYQTDGKITYSSSDTSVAVVDADGKVTMKQVGTCTITATAAEGDNYTQGSASYTLDVLDLKEQSIQVADHITKTYGDSSFQLGATALGNASLAYSSDDTDVVEVSADGTVKIVGSGTAYVTITAAETAEYQPGSVTMRITIKPKSVKACRMVLSQVGLLPYRDEYDQYVKIVDGNTVLEEGRDYSVDSGGCTSCDDIIEEVTVTVQGKGNYTDSLTGTLVPIRKVPVLSSAAISGTNVTLRWKAEPGAMGYLIYRKFGNGTYEAVKTISESKTTSWTDTGVSGSKEEISYCLKAYTTNGTKKCYTKRSNVKSVSFNAKKKSLNQCAITVGATKCAYTGKARCPAVAVKQGNVLLTKNVDYTVTYKNNVNVGTATITITGKGNYTGKVNKTFQITRGKQTIAAKSYTKKLGDKAFYLGAKTSGDGKLSYQSSNTKIAVISGSGKVTIKGVGSAKITITASATRNCAAATKQISVTVNPAAVKLTSVKSAKAGEMTAKWGKNTKAGGYQLQYATASNFKGAKAVTIKKAATTSTTVKKLTKGKKYYVRIRTYQKVSGKTYYSAWSASKNVTIKK